MVSFRSLMAISMTAPACAAIVDLQTIEGKHSACSEGYSKVHTDGLNGDLNEGAGGKYIWLCVKKSETDKPITDLTVTLSDKCSDLGSDWHRVSQAQDSNGDLNHGAGGKYIYLCYRKATGHGSIDDLYIHDSDCKDGFFRPATAGGSNGDLNQGAGGKYIYLCAHRGCDPSEASGQWEYLDTLSGTQSYTLKVGTSKSHSEEKTESWSQKVTETIKAGFSVKGKDMKSKTSVEIGHEQASSYGNVWSSNNETTQTVTYDKSYEGQALWQWQITVTDSCASTIPKTADYAITAGRFQPPKCLPGFKKDKIAYQTCSDDEHTLPGFPLPDEFQLKSDVSGKCIDIQRPSTANGANIWLWTCNGGDNQKWRWKNGELKNPISDKCIDIQRPSTANGDNIWLWTCNGGSNQQWQWSNGALKNPASGKCLTLYRGSTAKGTNIQLYTCNDESNEKWHQVKTTGQRSLTNTSTLLV